MEQDRKMGAGSTLMAVGSTLMAAGSTLMVLVIAFVLVLAAFYGLDHLIMGMQGLPLNLDLSPAG